MKLTYNLHIYFLTRLLQLKLLRECNLNFILQIWWEHPISTAPYKKYTTRYKKEAVVEPTIQWASTDTNIGHPWTSTGQTRQWTIKTTATSPFVGANFFVKFL